MKNCNIFLLSRNAWFLDFLNDELNEVIEGTSNILVVFNNAELSAEVRQKFDSIYLISNQIDHANISVCLDEVVDKLSEITKIIPAINIRIHSYNENLVYLTACLREKLNVIGLDAQKALCFTNKVVMKKVLADSSVNCPAYFILTKELIKTEAQALPALYQRVLEKLHSPFVIKPEALSGSRFLNIIHSYQDFLTYCNTVVLSNDMNTFLAEEYIEGTLFHCDTLIDQAGKMLCLVSQYNYPMHYFLEGKAVGSSMIEQDSEDAIKLKHVNEIVLKRFNAQKGIYHLEFFINKDGEPIFLEAAARPAGGLILRMLETCSGINLLKYDFLNWPVPDKVTVSCYAGWAFIPFRDGVVNNLKNPQLCSDYDIEWNIEVGKEYKKSQNLAEVAGKIFVLSYDKEPLKKFIEEF